MLHLDLLPLMILFVAYQNDLPKISYIDSFRLDYLDDNSVSIAEMGVTVAGPCRWQTGGADVGTRAVDSTVS